MIISQKISHLKVGANTKNYVTKGDQSKAKLAGQIFFFFLFFVFVLFLFLYKGNSLLIRTANQIDHFSGGTVWYGKYG